MKNSQYRIIYNRLLDDIKMGTYPEGGLLPSENQLCALFGTTRPTVRQALVYLENEGYIKRQQGKGSIVQGSRRGIGILSIHSTTEGFGEESIETKIICKPELRKWPIPFWFDLEEWELASSAIYLERLRLVNQVPVLFESTYVTNVNIPNFTRRNFENKSLFEMLRRHYNIKVTGGEQKIWTVNADEKLQSLLRVKNEQPLLHLKRKVQTSRPNFNLYSSLFCDTNAHFLSGNF